MTGWASPSVSIVCSEGGLLRDVTRSETRIVRQLREGLRSRRIWRALL